MAKVANELPATQAKKPPHRAYEWTADKDTPNRGILTTTVGKVTTVYRLREIVGIRMAGRAFALHKLSGGTDHESQGYDVRVTDAEAAGYTCECKGYHRHGHCTHGDAVRELCESGKFDPCPECAGHGYVPTADLSAVPCVTCNAGELPRCKSCGGNADATCNGHPWCGAAVCGHTISQSATVTHPVFVGTDDADDATEPDEPTPLSAEPGDPTPPEFGEPVGGGDGDGGGDHATRFRCPCCGYEAELVYDPATRALVVVWLDEPVGMPTNLSDVPY